MGMSGFKAGGVPRRAGSTSRAAYRRRGEKIVQRAGIASSRGGVDAAARLVGDAAARGGEQEIIAGNTLRVFRRQYSCAAQRIGEMFPEVDVDALIQEVDDALEGRRGKPSPKRTSANKIKDPTISEVHAICAALKTRILKRGDQLDLALLLYLVVAPRIGWRPVEMTRAWIDGDTLYIPTAKQRGAPAVRTRSLKRFAPVLKQALWILLALVPRGLDDRQFELWRNRLAGRLAYLSARLKRRLSLYFARHIGIATWKKAGLDPATIARLAGHLSLDAHRQHYARAAAGFDRDVHLVDDADRRLPQSPSDLDRAKQQQTAETFEAIRKSVASRLAAGDYEAVAIRRRLAGLPEPGADAGSDAGSARHVVAPETANDRSRAPAREYGGKAGEVTLDQAGDPDHGPAPQGMPQGSVSAGFPETGAKPRAPDDSGASFKEDSDSRNLGSEEDGQEPTGPPMRR